MTQQYRPPTASTGQRPYEGQNQQSYGGPTGKQPYGRRTSQQPYEGRTSQQPTGTGQRSTGTGQQSTGTGQQSTQTQMGRGGRAGQSHRTTHENVGQQFESELTVELNEALESFDRVVEIAEWCADKCIESGPEMAECARLCEDLADVASLNEKFIARDSINGPEVAEAFLRVAQQGLPVLQQHQQMPHVQETYRAVTQAMDATERLLNSIGGTQRSRRMGIQEQVQGKGQGQSFQQPQGQSFQQPQGQSFQQPQGQAQSFQSRQSY